MKIIFSSLAILSFSLFVWAGGGGSTAGNGGDVLVCGEGQVTFFDIFEAEASRGLVLDLGPKEMDPFAKVERVLKRIPVELGDWRDLLLARMDLFKAKHIVGDFELTDVSDTGNIIIKPGCEIKQAVIQRRTGVSIDPIFYIAKNYWAKMDNDSKAALILHEIIYYDAIDMGHTDSIKTRSINSYLMAKNLPQDPRCLFFRILQDSNLSKLARTYRLNREEDFWIDAGSSYMNENCVFEKAFVVYGFFNVQGFRMNPIETTEGNEDLFPMEWGVSGLSINNAENPEAIHFRRNFEIMVGRYQVDLMGVRGQDWAETSYWSAYIDPKNKFPRQRPGFISLYPDGKVKAASVKEMEIFLFGFMRKIRGEVFFSRDQEPSRVQFAPATNFIFQGKEYKKVSEVMIFHELVDGKKLIRYRFSYEEGREEALEPEPGHFSRLKMR